MAERHVWWGSGLMFVGLGAALFTGAGLATADADASDTGSSGSAPAGGSAAHPDPDADSDSASARSGEQTPGGSESVDPATVPASAQFGNVSVDDQSLADDAEFEEAESGDASAEVELATETPIGTDIETDTEGGRDEPVVGAAQSEAADDDPHTAVAAADPSGGSTSAATDLDPLVPAAALASSETVTGVKTGHSKLTIPLGDGYTTQADWYLPTQADGSVSATGVIWLQHGFLNRKSFVTNLASTLSQQTNSIVVAPNVASFPWRCAGCWLNGAELRQAVSTMFLGDRAELNTSATAAGYVGTLPQSFVLSGQSAGGGFATVVGGYYAADPASDGSLRGVVMFDGVAMGGVLTDALQSLDGPYIPVYQVAAPPQAWNAFGSTTNELVAARPDRFVGATLAGGSHADSLLGGIPIIDFFAQLVTKFSPPGNTAATHTLATGWINDMYQGLGPIDGNGIYGLPDQYIVMGDTAAVVLGPPPVVDVDRYLGTWYEVGSVKQFFSIGLVNTKAVYSLNSDGSIKVENSGNYFFNNGPESSIVGAALPVDPTNNKLNVRFFGPASDRPPGNYWIVDLSPDYDGPDGWAIVSDPTGFSGFLLSRSAIVSDAMYQELLDRASVKGVRGWITRTRQPGATASISA